MFKVTTDKQQLYKKYQEYYRNDKSETLNTLTHRLALNGVIMNVYAISRYFELNLTDTINIINETEIKSVIDSGVPYYFRGDIWDCIPAFTKKVKELVPENKRSKLPPIVDAMDVSMFYGVTAIGMRRVLGLFKLKRVKLHKTPNQFYLYSDIIAIKDHKSFKYAIAKSRIPVSVDAFDKVSSYIALKNIKTTEDVPFRDRDCQKYDACLDLAAMTSDYMDCTKCLTYQRKTNTVVSGAFDPSLVFLPRVDQKKIRSLRKVKHFPNA